MNKLFILLFVILMTGCSTTGFVVERKCVNEETMQLKIAQKRDTISVLTEINSETLEIDTYEKVRIYKDRVKRISNKGRD